MRPKAWIRILRKPSWHGVSLKCLSGTQVGGDLGVIS